MTKKRVLLLAPLQIAQAGIGFGAIATFTRLMSPDEFGRYALALAVSMFAHTLVFTWAESAAYRFFTNAKATNRLADHFATLIALAMMLGAAAFGLTAALLIVTGAPVDIIALSIFAAGAAAFRFLLRIARESERAALAVGRYAVAEALYLIIGFGAGVALLVLFDLGAAAPFAGLAAAGALLVLADAPRLLKQAKGGRVSWPRLGQYARYGAPLALAIAVDLGVQALARFLIAHEAEPAALGAYAAAFGFARAIDLVFIWAGAALTPMMLNAYEHDGASAACDAGGRIVVAIAALAAPCAIGLGLVAVPAMELLVGEGLRDEAAKALPWLALAGLFSGFNLYYLSEAFQLTRRTGVRALVMLAPGALQITLTAMLAGEHGAMGGAIAAAIGAGAASVLLVLIGRRFLKLPLPLGEFLRIGAATAAMTGVVLLIPVGHDAGALAAKVLSGAFTYTIVAILLNIGGARAQTSVLLQRFSVKLRGDFSSPITDQS